MEEVTIAALQNRMLDLHIATQAARKIRDIPAVELYVAESAKIERKIKRMKKGETIINDCKRCGGYGGSHLWPGYTCFECEGIPNA